ncbi:hypothetical protein [Acinetobacter baumannii]|uniref:hypothetical protein n=1 Tax=Acinetobacter baumannii TaxID=470 RepID=UPI000DE74ACE|nr:hypothetical protein [Acinetobacter baumannii]AZC09447.1 hypothetical protein DKE47_006355 [Acinetobacter nosocomialis]MCJ9074285.1 hypothetical protein [Acinetobacter baumannii]MCJ9563217.1 hypothetical protein [Acinetobacter baumannii]MDP7716933.1 hypothetical protein [Acinetobacter baumannii]SSQ25076.1 Uncharacterised protein [Acinetobacter baumannii]
MTIVNPIAPTRKELEVWCGGNQRILKALEAIFRLIPKELNNLDGSSSDAQISADSAATQASLAISQIDELKQLLEMVLLQSSACNCQCYQDIPIRSEHVQENLILSPAQLIEPDNLYLEVN